MLKAYLAKNKAVVRVIVEAKLQAKWVLIKYALIGFHVFIRAIQNPKSQKAKGMLVSE